MLSSLLILSPLFLVGFAKVDKEEYNEYCKESMEEGFWCNQDEITENEKNYQHLYYYNIADNECQSFDYKGCSGTKNKFATLETCMYVCYDGPLTTPKPTTTADYSFLSSSWPIPFYLLAALASMHFS